MSVIAPGTLYLVPAPLDSGCDEPVPLDLALPRHTLQITASITHWISENAKTTRAYRTRIGSGQHPHEAPGAFLRHRIFGIEQHFTDHRQRNTGWVIEANRQSFAVPVQTVIEAELMVPAVDTVTTIPSLSDTFKSWT